MLREIEMWDNELPAGSCKDLDSAILKEACRETKIPKRERKLLEQVEADSRRSRIQIFEETIKQLGNGDSQLVDEFENLRNILTRGTGDISSLPVQQRLWLTKEGIQVLAETYTKMERKVSLVNLLKNRLASSF